MTLQEIQKLEKRLEKKGYKKLVRSCKAEDRDDWEWYKAFYDKDKECKYQIFFCFWNFEQFQKDAGYSVSVIVIPNSTKDYVGRRDLHLSVDWSTNLVRVENCAEQFYAFIRLIDKS
jgi:hypothetical protein